MAEDFDPNEFSSFKTTAPSAVSSPDDFDPSEFKGFKGKTASEVHKESGAPSFIGALENAVTDYPSKVYEAGKSALTTLNETLNPFSEANVAEAKKRAENPSLALTDWTRAGRGLLAIPELAAAPITAAVKSAAPVIAAPMTSAIQTAGEPIAKALNPSAQVPSREEVYGQIEPEVETALGLVMPKGVRNPVPVPPPLAEPPLGVTLSKGQATGDLSAIQREQAALRGQSGPEAQRRAQAFADQQKAQLEAAKEKTGAQLDPFGQTIASSPQEAGDIVAGALGRKEQLQKSLLDQEVAALTPTQTIDPLDAADTVAQSLRNSADTVAASREQTTAGLQREHQDIRSDLNPRGAVLAANPQEAAEIVSGAVTRAEEQAREARDAAYDAFRDQSGQFNPTAFQSIGNNIRRSLNVGDDPVILNSKTTPMAVAAVQDMDRTLGAAAKNALSPDTKVYKPFTPAAVDDIRKRLVSFQRQANSAAQATRDYSDVRAMARVKDAFDDIVSNALQNPEMFSGDGQAVADAINNARGLHSELRAGFSRQGAGDKVGPIMQQIIGQYEGQAAPPNQISQWLYGTGQTPVMIARRMVSLFGADSPEVAALKQGLFSYITERPEGVTAWGPEQVADRIYDFINGRGRTLTQTYLSPSEQTRLRTYADNLRTSVAPPQAPTDIVARALSRINGVGGQGATSAELADTLFGRAGTGENPLGAKLAQHVRDTYGADSEPFMAMRQGMFSRLVRSEDGRLGFDPETIADQIKEFLTGRGRPTANILFSPEERTQLNRYADALRAHAERVAAPDNDVDRAIAKIVGRNGEPATAREIADLLYSRSIARDRNLSVNLARRLKNEFGESSPQWSAVKQGLFRQLAEPGEGMTDWGPGKIAQRLNKFLHVDGKEMSEAMFSPEERTLMQNYADLMRKIEVPQAGANWSNTATFMAKTMNNLGGKIGMIVGAAIGRAVLPFAPIGLSEGLGAVAAGAAGKVAQKIQARTIAKQMPLVAEQMKRWQRAVEAADRANTPPSQALATIATLNLSRALAPLGLNLRSLAQQGPGTAQGAPNQDSVPRPPPQQKDGGAVDQQQSESRAQGGIVAVMEECEPANNNPESQQNADWLMARSNIDTSPNDPIGPRRARGDGRANGGSVGEDSNYDYAAAQAAGVQPDERGHWPDTYKLPGHITFSDESQYHGTDGNFGGHWEHIDGPHWNFTPGPTNLQNYTTQQLQDYFQKYEPDSTLLLPTNRARGGRVLPHGLSAEFTGIPLNRWGVFDKDGTMLSSGKSKDEAIENLVPKRAAGGRVSAANINHNPTPAQAASGAYSKDHLHFQGLMLTIENAKGSVRHGVGRDGKSWSSPMPKNAHYGYIKRTEAADGDQIDVYLGPHPKASHVYVIDQVDADTKKYDEGKVMLGFGSEKQAIRTYEKGFSDGKGKQRIGKVTGLTMPQFKEWLRHGATDKPFAHVANRKDRVRDILQRHGVQA